ncbi:GyrI-like domain-containing protein [Desnuesiella massiliensis]|uniref:GyrI-like domain-containing protein n=1 Tax=Desnuesiella massiliensis TaxID=1650662 RepID=UPI0006E13EAB|nr:GyrI-like domain-containing protein [Desnuesiella massiliensis]
MSAELMDFKTINLGRVKVIGKEVLCKCGHPEGNPIPALWGKCHEDGTIKALEEHKDRLYKNALVGWMGKFCFKTNTFSYVVGIIADINADVPSDMVSYEIPECKVAVATIKGTEPDIYMMAHEFTENEIKKLNLKPDWNVGLEMEWYDERFCANKDYKIIDLYMSVV